MEPLSYYSKLSVAATNLRPRKGAQRLMIRCEMYRSYRCALTCDLNFDLINRISIKHRCITPKPHQIKLGLAIKKKLMDRSKDHGRR
jgi:hypothetical protein